MRLSKKQKVALASTVTQPTRTAARKVHARGNTRPAPLQNRLRDYASACVGLPRGSQHWLLRLRCDCVCVRLGCFAFANALIGTTVGQYIYQHMP